MRRKRARREVSTCLFAFWLRCLSSFKVAVECARVTCCDAGLAIFARDGCLVLVVQR